MSTKRRPHPSEVNTGNTQRRCRTILRDRQGTRNSGLPACRRFRQTGCSPRRSSWTGAHESTACASAVCSAAVLPLN